MLHAPPISALSRRISALSRRYLGRYDEGLIPLAARWRDVAAELEAAEERGPRCGQEMRKREGGEPLPHPS